MLGQAMMIDFGSPKQTRACDGDVAPPRMAHRHQLRRPAPGALVLLQRHQDGRGRRVGLGQRRAPTWSFIPRCRWCSSTARLRRARWLTEIADGFLAHRHLDADGKYRMHYTVNFHTNEDLPGSQEPWFILWAAYRWTGDKKYLVPFGDDPAASLRSINSDALDMLNVRDTWGKKVLQSSAPDRRDDSGNTPAKPTSILRGSSPATPTISTSSMPRRLRLRSIASSSTAKAACGSIASTSTTVSCSARGWAASR